MSRYVHICTAIFFLFYTSYHVDSSEHGEAVDNWANKLGKELYDLGQVITKSTEIKSRYSFLNAQVAVRRPEELLAEIVENIERMMDRKMDAIRCILKVAEDEAEAFEYNANDTDFYYYNSKYSPVLNEYVDLPESLQANRRMYVPMYLNNDTHFYNVAVNTTHSSVHVPMNIFDRHKDAQIAIQWSEALDRVFRQNYNSDPALSWQYFGSSSGIMRHYPAMKWMNPKMDLFDCRIRTWFIEAATCTKDIIILVDSSGSMQGMRKHIATYTISTILDTFSNNDYINVMNYSTSVSYVVPCFKDMLVQATRENIQTFKKAVHALDPDNKSDSTVAFKAAFDLLAQYREQRNCSENSSNCNQAVMLVTDGIAGNISAVFDEYNRYNNGSNIPVRVFTYLIGQEVLNVNEIMWAACTNKGYYAHVQSLEEVQGSVFKYIPVIARPLVLQSVDHPVSWTHAYADITYDDTKDNIFNEPYRLLTSVTVPAFDRASNRNNNSRTANLLGVAGTDVPIDDIRKLTMPYKIGVLGYAFIVSNNGYVLMHPGLRPVYKNLILKENYNSIDFAEVEQHDDNLPPREINEDVLELREYLVNGMEFFKEGARLKYHYDNFRRITRQKYDYYISPLVDTPFTVGLAIPSWGENHTIIQVGDEIQKNRHTGVNITSFFNGSNWKIHPKWVYCKYHYLEGHEFETPEQELLHFLNLMYSNDPKFKWARQYEATKLFKHQEFDIEVEDNDDIECGRKTLDDNDYYCDKDLIQLLIFDAKNTMSTFQNPWKFSNDREEILFKKYNATLRFVATMSGLTRWEYIFGEEDNIKTEFGDLHSRAIDEFWYKSAVLQHHYDRDSFVYTVPYEVGDDDETLVTSSYALFPKDESKEAPGSVVGFQFSHKLMEDRFHNITSTHLTDKNMNCNRDRINCYVVDHSGYIIIAPNANETGFFFGEVEGEVMKCMLDVGIYEDITIYDFQAFCENITYTKSSDGSHLQTPVDLGKSIINYIIYNIMYMFIKTNLYLLWNPEWVLAEEFSTTFEPPILNGDDGSGEEEEEGENEEDDNKKEEKIEYYSCDLKRSLYLLNQTKFIKGNGGREELSMNCSKPYIVKRIPHSNLILVSMNVTAKKSDIFYTTDPQDVEYSNDINHPCQKLSLTKLPRRRLTGCYNEHPLESEIDTCGRSSKITYNLLPLTLISVIMYTIT